METRLLQLRDTATEEAALTSSNRRLAEQKEARAARKQEHESTKNAMIEAVTEVGQDRFCMNNNIISK